MQRFRNILMISGREARDKTTLERATTLAKKNQARMTVVKVIKRLPRHTETAGTKVPAADLRKIVLNRLRQELEQLAAPIRQKGVDVNAVVLAGTPFLEITRAVLRNNHDLVIMTAEGEGGVKERLFGSTSLHLMRKCPCPIWVMKPTQSSRFGRILAAVDTDPDDLEEEKDALNTIIMDLAISLARQEQAELHVVHAWAMFAEQALRSPRARVSERQVDEWVCEDRERHKRQLDVLLGKYTLESVDFKVHLVKGKAESLIPDMAREKQVDLIVMGTVCRIGIAGFFIGPTAEKVLQHVDCSVLTVKPEGFVSPVTLGTP